ncbi:MAG: entericidin A/B family lipoprotein [Pseudomonadota bacterium]|nr:entericidin A/B family lipoprotein [Pseudomonadota bacterium]
MIRTAVLALALVLSLAACNTMEGFGRDVEKTGEEIQKSTD